MGIFGVEQSAKLPSQTIENPQTIGEHLRKRRQELKIYQKSVAKDIGVSEDCITLWENNRSQPQIKHYPKIIRFLGYNPFQINATTVGEKIKNYRMEQGFSIKQFAKTLKIEERALASWEKDKATPKIAEFQKLQEFIS